MGFDKKKEYDELYKGFKKDYLNKLVIKRIPFVFICATADDGKKTEYKKEIFGPGPMELTLSQDYFREVYGKEQIEAIIGEDALEPIEDDTDEVAVDRSTRQLLLDTVRKSKEPVETLPAAETNTETDGVPEKSADAPHFMPPIVNEEALKTMIKDTDQNFSACQFTWEGNEPLIKQDNRSQEQKAYRAINLLCQNIKCGDDSFGRVIEEKLRREQERKDKKLEAEQTEQAEEP